MSKKWLLVIGAGAALAFGAAACGGDDGDGNGGASNGEGLSGTIRIDGSSTVAPLGRAAADLFQQEESGVQVTVGTSGTSGGFEKFCRGETDISQASRPIKEEEIELCGENGIEYAEVQVANDALGAVVNPQSPLECISVESLSAMWDTGSEVNSWADVPGLEVDMPDEEFILYGPGTDSGTFDYWTEAINGEEGRIRNDYSDIGEDDNAAVTGVAGGEWDTAYIPFSYVQEAGDQVKALAVENPDSGECVEPTIDNVQSGDYAPLGRPLFIYPSADALGRPEVLAFIDFYVEQNDEITEIATFVPMNDDQVAESQQRVEDLLSGGGA